MTYRDLLEILKTYELPMPKCASGREEKLGEIFFSGWYVFYEGVDLQKHDLEERFLGKLDIDHPVVIGRWQWYNPKDRNRNICVVIPSLRCNIYAPGDYFDLGTERFTPETPPEVLEYSATEGLGRIQNFVHEETAG